MNLVNPKVTVYMSAYNHEAYVEQAILSIVNQTYQDFELLVIDDGSTDNTPVILERLSQEHGFYFERQENMGLPRTLNTLMGMAKGEYFTGSASDDFWPLNRLELQVEAMDANPRVDIIHGDFKQVDTDGHIIEACVPVRKPISGSGQFLPCLCGNRRYSAPTMMIRSVAWMKVGPYDVTILVEDFDWFLRAVRCCEIIHIKSDLVYYRKHNSNWTTTSGGLTKIADSSYLVARKLGLVYGAIFLFCKSPLLYQYECAAGRKRRYFFRISTWVGLRIKSAFRFFRECIFC